MLAIFLAIAWRIPLLAPVPPTPTPTPFSRAPEVQHLVGAGHEDRKIVSPKGKSQNVNAGSSRIAFPYAIIVGIASGVISSLIVVVLVEWMRKPSLALTIRPPEIVGFYGLDGKHLENYMALKISVSNNALPVVFRWMQRQSARDCRATLRFLREDETSFIERLMPGRWAGSVQPVPLRGTLKPSGETMEIDDIGRLTAESKIDIPAGQEEFLDVAVRFQNAPEAFGWTNESYRHGGRHPGFTLPTGRYLVDIVVRSEGVKKQKRFRIENDHTIDEFRVAEL